jgi:hypothetical protein
MGRIAAAGNAPARADPAADLLAVAELCTELGRLQTLADVQPLLREAAALLGAKGLVVWVWDAAAGQLRPVLVHGYPEEVFARVRGVGLQDDNLTAAAFRSSQTLAVGATVHASGALAVPLLTGASCAGVLAIEFPDGREQTPSARAVATVVAAMLAQLVRQGRPAARQPSPRVAAGDDWCDHQPPPLARLEVKKDATRVRNRVGKSGVDQRRPRSGQAP